MAADFGTDITAIPDLSFEIKTGIDNLAEAIARRFITPPGGLFYDLEYGRDLRDLVNKRYTPDMEHEEASAIAAEAEKDDRVISCDATLTMIDPRNFKIALSIEAADGPFEMVMAISAVTVEVLHVNTL